MSTPETTGRRGGWLGALAWLALIAAIAGTAAMAVAGPGYQEKWWDLGFAFRTLMGYGGWVVLAAGAVGLVLTLMFLIRGPARLLVPSILALLISGAVLAQTVPLLLDSGARPQLSKLAGVTPVPVIHDITTDTEDPPQFDAAVRLREQECQQRCPPPADAGADATTHQECRKRACNPSEYAGADTAAAQLAFEGYADIRPAYFDAAPDQVFDRALKIVQDNGWLVMNADKENGIIEAAETSRWFGFTDDVVIRLRATDDGRTRVDMRSKSRMGRSDVGMNAKRIRRFMAKMQEE